MPRIAFVLAVALAVAAPARAEVLAAGPGGFHLGGRVPVAAPREAVWAALVEPDAWWSAGHRWFEGSRLTLDLAPGGCWCEQGADGQGAQHLTVGFVDPGRTLRLLGGLGPLQTGGLSGALTLELSDAEDGEGTVLGWRYAVSGYVPNGAEAWAAPVDGVLTQQLARLKALAEETAGGR